MARQREDSTIVVVLQIAALLFLAALFSPLFRGVLVWTVLVAGVALLAVIAYRIYIGSRSTTPFIPSGEDSSKDGLLASQPSTDCAQVSISQRVRSLDWFQFEQLIGILFEQQGLAVTRFGGANPDAGIDLTIARDQQVFGVQCKHWKTWKVGVKELREFLGALTDRTIQRGIFVALQGYSGQARDFAAAHNIQLIDDAELIRILEALHWQSNDRILAILTDKRKLCPKCESEMVLRTARQGRNVGQQFWGCLAFPRCRYTFPYLPNRS